METGRKILIVWVNFWRKFEFLTFRPKLKILRERVSDVIREEFADRIVKAEKDLERTKSEMAESEARHRNEYSELKRYFWAF